MPPLPVSYEDVANLLFARILFPYLKKRYGKGSMARVTKASKAVAQSKPNLSYIWIPNSGKAAARTPRVRISNREVRRKIRKRWHREDSAGFKQGSKSSLLQVPGQYCGPWTVLGVTGEALELRTSK